MIIIGIDPDSKAHGVAVYKNGKLIKLESMALPQFYNFLMMECGTDDVQVHIEDVQAKKAVWHNKKGSQAAYGMTCQRVGMCKQAQSELERVCEYFVVKVVRHKISKTWKDQAGKKQFEKVTGWSGRSNEDTRSAAYFGWLGSKPKVVLT